MMNQFQPYIFEPERHITSECSSDENNTWSDTEERNEGNVRVGNLIWCACGNCSSENREIDCLCCQEVDALNSKFDEETIPCVTDSTSFKTLCTNELVLKNVLTGLHESKGDCLEENWSNRTLRYAAYKQFISF